MKSRLFQKDEAGFGVVAFLALIPLLMAVLALISGVVLLLKTDARLKHECRTELLKAQRGVANDLNLLIKLNKISATLRTTRTAAEIAEKAARAVPPTWPAANAFLQSVKLAQSAHKKVQLSLISRSSLSSRTSPTRASYAVIRRMQEEAIELSGGRANSRSRLRSGSFEVDESPKGNDSPDFTPSKQFTERSRMDVEVTFDLAPLLPDWIKALLPTRYLKLKTRCQASIEKEDGKWIEKLSAVR